MIEAIATGLAWVATFYLALIVILGVMFIGAMWIAAHYKL